MLRIFSIICAGFFFCALLPPLPPDVRAQTVYWEDTFQRPDGDAGNGWASVNGASAVIAGNGLHRTDSGNYRILYNPAGGTLPADYYVTMTVPHSLLGTSWWGLIGRYLPTGGDGTGLKVFWMDQGALSLGVGHGSFSNDIAITVTGGYPASWSEDRDHLVTLGFAGDTVTVYLDGSEYGYFTDSTNNRAGTGIGFVGDGGSGAYDVLNVKVTDYIPGASGISGVASTTTDASATITWRTPGTAADSTVEYGPTTDYGSVSSAPAMVTSHSVTITGLTPNTLYHYRVTSMDGEGHIMTSSDSTFTTAHHIYPDEVTFLANGSTFAAILAVDEGATILWTFEDGTTSGSATPAKNYGSPGNRVNRLKVTPWSALKIINIGYDGGDGGTADTPYLDQQNVTAVYGMDNIAPYLAQWASSHNPLTTLDFSNFTNLRIIECFLCQSVTSVNLHNTPLLQRADFEDNNLSSLDLSDSPSLADLRGATNNYPAITWGATGAHVWHICIRDNPQMTAGIPDLDSQFPLLRELFIWNTNQSGTLHPTSRNLASVLAANNHYTAADFSGDFPSGSWGTIDVSHNNLTSLNISDDPGLVNLIANNNSLGQAAVDGVLQTLDSFGTGGGTVDLQANAVPSGPGLGHAAALRSRGWTVNLEPDTTPPTVTLFTIPATYASRVVPITALAATDDSGVAGYLLTESATAPSSGDPAWSAAAPVSHTFATAGSKTLFAWAKDTSGNVSAGVPASVVITLDTLSVAFAGTEAGRVTSVPPGIDCTSAPCSALYDRGTAVTLTAAAGSGSIFSSWGGDCSVINGKCGVVLNGNRNAVITFSTVQPVRVEGSSSPYTLIGGAYGEIADGGTIQAREYEFVENLNFNRPIDITLEGGYDTLYDHKSGVSAVRGTVTITRGSVILENIAVE